jgi:hypothetical protein
MTIHKHYISKYLYSIKVLITLRIHHMNITDVGSSHMVVWQPRTRQWSRHTDNVAGSSDAKSKREAMRQWGQ